MRALLAARRAAPLLVGLLGGCDTVVVDVEPVHVMLESSTVGGAAAAIKGCGDEELGLKGVGPVWIGLRRFDRGWQWVCEDVGADGGTETLLGLEQRLATVSFESIEPGGEWDVWIVGYLKGTPCDVPKDQFGRLCGSSARFVMPPPGNRVTLPVSCVPGLVTDKQKVIEAAVKECFERLFPP